MATRETTYLARFLSRQTELEHPRLAQQGGLSIPSPFTNNSSPSSHSSSPQRTIEAESGRRGGDQSFYRANCYLLLYSTSPMLRWGILPISRCMSHSVVTGHPVWKPSTVGAAKAAQWKPKVMLLQRGNCHWAMKQFLSQWEQIHYTTLSLPRGRRRHEYTRTRSVEDPRLWRAALPVSRWREILASLM